MTDIAIIGGGAAGAAVFGELLQRKRACTIHWIVGASSPGRGVAYSTDDDRHLLNVRADKMGLFLHQPYDFLEHASGELASVSGSDFLPRRLFGDFVQAQVAALIHSARQQGQSVEIHRASAIDITPAGDDRYSIALHDGRRIEVDGAVLALGALPPRALRCVTSEARESGAYKLDPWNLASDARNPRRVVVIGTGLTAVDTLLTVSTRWPNAQMVAVSRHGLLPSVHARDGFDPYPDQQTLNNDLLSTPSIPQIVRKIRRAITEHAGDWRSVVDGLRPINSLLWQGLTTRQRWQFLRHVRWVWEAGRHRVPPASHGAIEQLREEGRLAILAARVLRVEGSAPLRLTIRDRASQLNSILESDLVIQATGLDTACAYTEHPLISRLLENGMVVPDPLQLGIATEIDGQILSRDGRAQPGLYALGSLLRGGLWECTAMPEIRKAAHGVANRLTDTVLPFGVVGGASSR
jgi:uncharacterized NAD(P)/FAD-binding protein YdhS